MDLREVPETFEERRGLRGASPLQLSWILRINFGVKCEAEVKSQEVRLGLI